MLHLLSVLPAYALRVISRGKAPVPGQQRANPELYSTQHH